MKLGFVSAILPELSLISVMTLASEIGYDCVEVMCWPKGVAERRYAGVTHIDAAQLNDETIDEIHKLVAKTGVDISGLGYYPNPLTPDEEEAKTSTDHIESLILAAKSLGLKNVNTFIGRDWTRSVDENWPRFEKTWKPLIALAEESDIRIGIENCPMFFLLTMSGPVGKIWLSLHPSGIECSSSKKNESMLYSGQSKLSS